MIIEVNSVTPTPMLHMSFPEDSLWNAKNQVFESGKNYLVKAHSGRGKSSFIAFLYGLRNDYRGDIFNDKRNLKEFSLTDWSNIRTKDISVVIQDMRLFPHLTVKENLILKNQLTNHKDWDEIQGMLDRYGIGDKTEQMCGTLSIGQQQRVALIRGLCQPFKFLFMDEPFSHLDVENQKIGCELIQEECTKNGAGLILASLGEHYFFNYDHIVTI